MATTKSRLSQLNFHVEKGEASDNRAESRETNPSPKLRCGTRVTITCNTRIYGSIQDWRDSLGKDWIRQKKFPDRTWKSESREQNLSDKGNLLFASKFAACFVRASQFVEFCSPSVASIPVVKLGND